MRIPPRARATCRTDLRTRFKVTEVAFMMDWDDSGSSSDDDTDGDDWEELAREERMAKKLKRGDISQTDFDNEFADL